MWFIVGHCGYKFCIDNFGSIELMCHGFPSLPVSCTLIKEMQDVPKSVCSEIQLDT